MLKKSKTILFLLFSLLFLNAKAAYNTKDVSQKRIDSLNLAFLKYALETNGQKNTLKKLVDTTQQGFNFDLIHAFFDHRKEQVDVKNIDAYKGLLEKINGFKIISAQHLDSIFSYYKGLKLFNQRSTQEYASFADFEGRIRSDFKVFTSKVNTPSRDKIVKNEKTLRNGGEPVMLKKKDYLYKGLFFLGGCMCVMLIWFIIHLRKRKRNGKMNSQYEDEYLNKKIIADSLEVKELLSKIKEKDNTLKKAEIRINELEDEVSNLKEQISALTGTKAKVDFPEDKASNLALESFPASYLYFPSPLSDGSFRKIDGRTTFSEGASIYRFKLISDNEAVFEFCEDISSVSMALNNRNDLILSVSDEMEGHYAGAKKVMIYKGKMGRVQLVDNKWLLVQKAQIKYV